MLGGNSCWALQDPEIETCTMCMTPRQLSAYKVTLHDSKWVLWHFWACETDTPLGVSVGAAGWLLYLRASRRIRPPISSSVTPIAA